MNDHALPVSPDATTQAVERLRVFIERHAPRQFRDDDGVAHDSAMHVEMLAALDALAAALQQAEARALRSEVAISALLEDTLVTRNARGWRTRPSVVFACAVLAGGGGNTGDET